MTTSTRNENLDLTSQYEPDFSQYELDFTNSKCRGATEVCCRHPDGKLPPSAQTTPTPSPSTSKPVDIDPGTTYAPGVTSVPTKPENRLDLLCLGLMAIYYKQVMVTFDWFWNSDFESDFLLKIWLFKSKLGYFSEWWFNDLMTLIILSRNCDVESRIGSALDVLFLRPICRD